MGPVGAASLLRRAVALHVHDVQRIHVQSLALARRQGRVKRKTKKAGETTANNLELSILHIIPSHILLLTEFRIGASDEMFHD